MVREAYVAARAKFPQYSADPRSPFLLWLRLEVDQKFVDAHRFDLGLFAVGRYFASEQRVQGDQARFFDFGGQHA
jgi:hypothetical protein